MKDRPSINAFAAAPASSAQHVLVSPGALRPSVQAFRDEAFWSPLISLGRNGLKGYHVLRSPGALHLHPAFNENTSKSATSMLSCTSDCSLPEQ